MSPRKKGTRRVQPKQNERKKIMIDGSMVENLKQAGGSEWQRKREGRRWGLRSSETQKEVMGGQELKKKKSKRRRPTGQDQSAKRNKRK